MRLLRTFAGADPDSIKGKAVVAFVDRIVIGAFVGAALGTYHSCRAEIDADREARAAEIQLQVERARVSADLLPAILDGKRHVVGRGSLLSSALAAELISPDVAIDLLSVLHGQGIPDSQFQRTAAGALPAGLAAVARRGADLRDEARAHGDPQAAFRVRAVSNGTSDYVYVASDDLPATLQTLVNERLAWATLLRDVLPRVPRSEEQEIVTRRFLIEHTRALYFLIRPNRAETIEELFSGASRTLKVLGALGSVLGDWGPTRQAAAYIGQQLGALDLTSEEDLAYALALVSVVERDEYRRAGGSISPHMAVHLAKLLVDNSFRHRIAWLPDDASMEERAEWWAEDAAADAHSSLQFVVGEALRKMGSGAQDAEGILVAFVDEFVRNTKAQETEEALLRLSSQYGSYPMRTAVAVLRTLDSEVSTAAVENVRQLGSDKLRFFEGIAWELGDSPLTQ